MWKVKKKKLCSSFVLIFTCFWILLQCLYFYNNCSILLFLFCSQVKYSLFFTFYDKFNFMLQILINILGEWKIKIKSYGISTHNHILFYYYNDLIKLFSFFFWWFYFSDTKNALFAWFNFLICLNYFLLLFMLIILEI